VTHTKGRVPFMLKKIMERKFASCNLPTVLERTVPFQTGSALGE